MDLGKRLALLVLTTILLSFELHAQTMDGTLLPIGITRDDAYTLLASRAKDIDSTADEFDARSIGHIGGIGIRNAGMAGIAGFAFDRKGICTLNVWATGTLFEADTIGWSRHVDWPAATLADYYRVATLLRKELPGATESLYADNIIEWATDDTIVTLRFFEEGTIAIWTIPNRDARRRRLE